MKWLKRLVEKLASNAWERQRKGKIEVWYDENTQQIVHYRQDTKSYSWDLGKTWEEWSLGGPATYKNHHWVKYSFLGFKPIPPEEVKK